jgi:hypothetical protein
MHTRSPFAGILLTLLMIVTLWGCEREQPSHEVQQPPAVDRPAPPQESVPEPTEPAAPSEPAPAEEAMPEEPAVEPDPQPGAHEAETEPAPAVTPEPEPRPAPAPEQPQAPPAPGKESAALPKIPSDPMVLTAPEGVEMKQAPVSFSHGSHSDLECTACHHMWDGKGDIGGCMDQGCHDLVQAVTPQERRDPLYFYNAFHARTSLISCVGCHSDGRKAGLPTGPVGCQECHTRE